MPLGGDNEMPYNILDLINSRHLSAFQRRRVLWQQSDFQNLHLVYDYLIEFIQSLFVD